MRSSFDGETLVFIQQQKDKFFHQKFFHQKLFHKNISKKKSISKYFFSVLLFVVFNKQQMFKRADDFRFKVALPT